jgi:hypothetical protein
LGPAEDCAFLSCIQADSLEVPELDAAVKLGALKDGVEIIAQSEVLGLQTGSRNQIADDYKTQSQSPT